MNHDVLILYYYLDILIDYQGSLKLSDFGAAKIGYSKTYQGRTVGRMGTSMNANSLAGTPMYMAPEVITGGETGRKGSMDIWSLACCIVQMATGRRPWSTLENEWSVMYHVVTGHPPLPDSTQLSPLGIEFLKLCFTRNPAKRPTAQELLNHPWILKFLEENYYLEENGDQVSASWDEAQQLAAAAAASPIENGGGGIHPPPQQSNGSATSSTRSSILVRSIPNSLALFNREEALMHIRNQAEQEANNNNINGNHTPPPSSSSSRPSSLLFPPPQPSVIARDFASMGRRESTASTASLVRSVDENDFDDDDDRPSSPTL